MTGRANHSAPASRPGRTLADLVAFIKDARTAGLISPGQAKTWDTACRQVLSATPGAEGRDLTGLDTEAVITRFRLAYRDSKADSTLQQQASGFRRAQELYRWYLADPGRIARFADNHPDAELVTTRTDGATVLRIPLARGRHMALEIPPDLTKADMLLARKLIGVYLHHLPLPIEP